MSFTLKSRTLCVCFTEEWWQWIPRSGKCCKWSFSLRMSRYCLLQGLAQCKNPANALFTFYQIMKRSQTYKKNANGWFPWQASKEKYWWKAVSYLSENPALPCSYIIQFYTTCSTAVVCLDCSSSYHFRLLLGDYEACIICRQLL